MLKQGDTAPDFTLFDTDKKPHTLSEYRGKNVLLLFFPMAFTGVCTKELCGVRDDMARYSDTDAQVFGISVDSVFSLGKFKEEQNLNFPLLSDFNKTATKAYGVAYEAFTDMKMEGVSKRSAFLVDKEGKIAYAEVLESAGDLPDFEKINAKLGELA